MPEPSYLRVADALRAIISGADPGTQLPSITALTAAHDVSTGVVQRAYAVLIEEGLVLARPGAGYYVRSAAAPERLVRRQRVPRGEGSPTAVTMARQGVAGSWRSETATAAATETVAARLCIQAGDPVMHTSYVYLADGQPSYLAESWEPMAVTGATLIVLPEAGPYAGIGVADRMAVIGIDVGVPVERVTARAMTRQEAHALGAAPGGPVLAIERTYYDQATGRAVETADITLPGDRWIAEYGLRPGGSTVPPCQPSPHSPHEPGPSSVPGQT
ncbi:GntR family transcriptional regulator [Kitasatospora cheerisanensis]|uniref:GntR family transcriptional regulator n=1 Tax=Kitasatospora cheerisanensis KCTC 2395 TaxID=1348663 RepID=A0A066YZS3_9ACTN|nr:GntR family transcriptional regulator [Kitasatospora cheerisanensis]KDN86697.1 GntR family transcriptional regulator [Kitasatospora cheerisanensis KCTC 2395]